MGKRELWPGPPANTHAAGSEATLQLAPVICSLACIPHVIKRLRSSCEAYSPFFFF